MIASCCDAMRYFNCLFSHLGLYDLGVSISSCKQKLKARSRSSEEMLPRHVAALVKCNRLGHNRCEKITYHVKVPKGSAGCWVN